MKTKDKIRTILLENAGKNVSGEFLACECGVSRAAVWKAVNSLRENGLEIEGTTNGGYRLLNALDILSEETVRSDLQFFASGDNGEKENIRKTAEKLLHSKIQVFEEIDSTNSYAKRFLSEAGNLRDSEGNLTEAGKNLSNSICIAEKQTAGRGRLGRTFYSPEKNGVYISMIYAPRGGIKNPALVTALAALAVKRAINKLYNLNVQIKWINDIFYNGRKLCGILAEGITNFESGLIEAAVVGIGLNVYSNFGEGIPEEVRRVMTSLEEYLFDQEKGNLQKADDLRDLQNIEDMQKAENLRDLQNKAECFEKPVPDKQNDCINSPAVSLCRSKLAALIAVEFFSIMESIWEEKDSVGESSTTAAFGETLSGAVLEEGFCSEVADCKKNLQNLMVEYQEASCLIGREIFVHPVAGAVSGVEKETYKAIVLGIDQNASLLVELEDGSRKSLSSGEVSIGSGNV
ncbi:MAG: biotin--[acetyl-CoA-carboxylase] ligase [Treponema sp.]|nr:biotin--[acetyl-CoA-carboxylase] ligase [Treponema sp.]